MNQVLVALIGSALVAAGGFGAGWRINGWRIAAEQQRVDDVEQRATTAATTAAVQAIQQMRPVINNIRQETIRETHVEPRYLATDCSHTDAVWLQLGAAYTAAGGSLGGAAGLPAAPIPGRPDAGRDDRGAH